MTRALSLQHYRQDVAGGTRVQEGAFRFVDSRMICPLTLQLLSSGSTALVLLLSFAAGAVDALLLPPLHVFVSNQTGLPLS
jgi:hypothetical protein